MDDWLLIQHGYNVSLSLLYLLLRMVLEKSHEQLLIENNERNTIQIATHS